MKMLERTIFRKKKRAQLMSLSRQIHKKLTASTTQMLPEVSKMCTHCLIVRGMMSKESLPFQNLLLMEKMSSMRMKKKEDHMFGLGMEGPLHFCEEKDHLHFSVGSV